MCLAERLLVALVLGGLGVVSRKHIFILRV
jgi:hypothetical protein